MRIKKYFIMALTALTMMAVGCGKDDEPDSGKTDPELPDQPVVDEPMTPVESKEYLENTAKEVLNKFKAADQQEAIEFARYFVDNYEDYEMPEEFSRSYYSKSGAKSPAHAMMHGLLSSLSGGRWFLLASATDNYYYDFDNYAGVYEPSSRYYEWRKTESSNKVIFRYKNASGETCEITAEKLSDGTSTFVYDDRYESHTVYIPNQVKVSVTQGGKELVSSVVDAEYNSSAMTALVKVDATLQNINVKATVNVTNTKINVDQTLYVSGEALLTATGSVNGLGLCDQDKIENLIDNEFDSDIVAAMVTNATAEANLYNKVVAKGSLSKISNVIEDLDFWYDNYDGTRDEGKKVAENTAERLNANVVTEIYYTGEKNQQAKFVWEPDLYESSYSTWWYWELEMKMMFLADNTKYSLDDYFGNNRFFAVENLWESILDNYERIWDR